MRNAHAKVGDKQGSQRRGVTSGNAVETNAAANMPRAFIECTAEGYPGRAVFKRFSDRARNQGWAHVELPTGHDCHVEMPDAFVSKLLLLLR